jgi:hypothetical protein
MDRFGEAKSRATGHWMAWLAVVAAFVVVDSYSLRQAQGLEQGQALQRYGTEAKAGHAEAQYALGVAYETGHGVDQDYGEALGWYLQAAEQGHADAQTNAGALHGRGLGVPQDYAKAAEYYRLAADQGHGPALAELGALYFRGLGVPRDYVEARRWLRPTAEQGHPAAQWLLCMTYARGLGVDRNPAEAKAWCRKAAEAGHVWAQEVLGRLYDDWGFPPDYAQALEWYGRASDQGSAVARLRMSSIYRLGRRGVRRDPVKALAYLDYALIGERASGGRRIVVTTVGNAPDGSAGQGERNFVMSRMSKEEIAEAQELVRQWTGGEASSDDPVIEYAHPD